MLMHLMQRWRSRFNNESIHYIGLLVDVIDQATYLTAGEKTQWEMIPGTCSLVLAKKSQFAAYLLLIPFRWLPNRLCAVGACFFIPAEAQNGPQRMENASSYSVHLITNAESLPFQFVHQSPVLENQYS